MVALFICEGKVNIFNSKLSDNRALVDGGAIYAEKGTVKVTLSNFTDNATQDNDGGAIYAISDVNVLIVYYKKYCGRLRWCNLSNCVQEYHEPL